MDKKIKFKIPDTYLIDNLVSGNGLIEIYETKGKINLPLDKYKMEEFKVTIDVKAGNATQASIANINVLVTSRVGVEGGKDIIGVDELRDSIINNSTGDIDVPITTHNIKRKGEFDNFEISKALDIITSTVFIASKNLPDYESKLLYAKPDIYFNKLSIAVSDVTDMNSVITTTDYLLIKSGTVFKENNFKMEIVRNTELATIENMNNNEKIFKLKERKYFFTPYHYLVDTTDKEITKSRVYDLDNPLLKNIKIVGKNTNVLTRVNTDQYGVYKTANGYKVVFTLITNKEFGLLNPALIKGQFSIPLISEDTKLHFQTNYDVNNNRLEFDIDTKLFIDEYDYITIDNGYAVISNKLVSLVNDCELYIYSTENGLNDDTHYLETEISRTDNATVFNKEVINLTFGQNIKYIWNRFYNTYTERMYQKYTYDLPLVYEKDVYKIFPETGTIFNCVDDGDGGTTTETEILHKQGDPVLDSDGLPVYKFRKGDVILDEDNKPIIDTISGVVRNIDIMMLEYEFKVANSTPYKNYLDVTMSNIANWLYVSVPKLNGSLLENTEILYKSYKSVETIHVKSNDSVTDLRYNISPNITVYSKVDNYSGSDIESMKNTIGKILHTYLNTTVIRLSVIKDEILRVLGSDIVGVKIDGIDTANNAEVFNILDNTKRLILDKRLTINKNNDLIVKYAINLNINTI
jgi:hypothetical protein